MILLIRSKTGQETRPTPLLGQSWPSVICRGIAHFSEANSKAASAA
jgi:hypothetical protein